ncbi:MAG TPA: hypothetical protein VG013_35710 [Gemmataceae bacterium]|nr:hypothetical protein [Gemmataceae bacterium]
MPSNMANYRQLAMLLAAHGLQAAVRRRTGGHLPISDTSPVTRSGRAL